MMYWASQLSDFSIYLLIKNENYCIFVQNSKTIENYRVRQDGLVHKFPVYFVDWERNYADKIVWQEIFFHFLKNNAISHDTEIHIRDKNNKVKLIDMRYINLNLLILDDIEERNIRFLTPENILTEKISVYFPVFKIIKTVPPCTNRDLYFLIKEYRYRIFVQNSRMIDHNRFRETGVMSRKVEECIYLWNLNLKRDSLPDTKINIIGIEGRTKRWDTLIEIKNKYDVDYQFIDLTNLKTAYYKKEIVQFPEKDKRTGGSLYIPVYYPVFRLSKQKATKNVFQT